MWRNAEAHQGQRLKVPEESGVYVIADVERACGLPVGFDALYCGKTTNLRRRFTEHIGEIEPNPMLRKFMRNGKDTEFWWRRVPSDNLNSVEKELISQLKPQANIVGNRAVSNKI